jgi:hypothetical protein
MSRRRFRFGSVCTDLRPQDGPTCLSYNNGGMYPCNWSGGSNSRCQTRSGGPVTYSKAKAGKYGYYIDNSQMAPPQGGSDTSIQEMFPFLFNEYTPPASQNIPSPPPMGSSYSTGSACKGLNERICKGNPNCTYTINGCVRHRGTVKGGLVFEGPSLQFGKKRLRKKSGKKRSVKKAAKKLPAKIRKLCKRLKIKTTKRVGRRRVRKSIKILMKQIRMRMKKMKKTTRRTRCSGTRCTLRR